MKKLSLIEIVSKQFPETHRDVLYTKIMCGEVLVNGEKNPNPSCKVPFNSKLTFVLERYVSRAGLKLEAALKEWNIDVKNKIFLDAGSSTGGFTDCLLKNGAVKVFAVDVGYNQLAYSLRKDPRVIVYEKRNIMSLSNLDSVPNAGVADLSFRSISGAGRHIINLTSEKWMITLIKPQFEIDTLKYPEFKGIIYDKSILHNVLMEVLVKLDKDMLRKSNVSAIAGFNFMFFNFEANYVFGSFLSKSYTMDLADGNSIKPYEGQPNHAIFIKAGITLPLNSWTPRKVYAIEMWFRRLLK